MWIDPDNKTYTDTFPLPSNNTAELMDQVKEMNAKLRSAELQGKVTVRGDREQLRKLQDDLRKRGYKKLR